MSQFISAQVRPSSSLADTVRRQILDGWRHVKRELAIRDDLHALEAMNDAGLADLGISRGGLDGAVRHGRPPLAHTSVTGDGSASDTSSVALPADVTTEWR